MPMLKSFPVLAGPGRMLRPFETLGDDSPTIVSVNPNSGNILGGSSVTIVGTNFIADGTGGGIVVTFNGQPATSVVIVDRQTITCVTPAFAATGAVDVVVTRGSKSATLAGSFYVYETVVTGITPTHGPLAGGTSVLISGYNFKIGSSVTFGGAAATNVIWIDAEHIRCTTPSHATGFVDVVVTEP
jgi:hypothetical protein